MAVSVMAGIPALKDISADLKRRMDQAVADFQSNLASTRTGRASGHMLDSIKVDYYGTPTPITQMAQVSTPEAQLILIQPWDPSVIKEIEKAIQASDLGFNPQTDGNDALKKLAKDKKISEDEEKRAMEEVQKMTDEEIRRMEEMSRRKEAEVMQV